MAKKETLACLCFLLLVLGLAAGTAIGYFALVQSKVRQEDSLKDESFMTRVLDEVKAENIRSNLWEVSRLPHLAALKRDVELAEMIKERWESEGLDSVEMVAYDVLLSFPNRTNPNKVYLVDERGRIVFQTNHIEEEVNAGDWNPTFVHSFNGYSPKGTVAGQLVYVNYARQEDFELLESMGVDVNGKICLSRYGEIFRGNKVQNAHEKGARGIIFYTDPGDVAVEGVRAEDLYPHTVWLPGSGMQRGSVALGMGDPLTPYWPSIEGAYRIDIKDAVLPKIPSQPIGYKDAERLLRLLGGPEAPKDWRGGFSNITYTLGPGFDSKHRRYSIRLTVNNELRRMTSYNVIGRIHGAIEPVCEFHLDDRYVIQGNHRDAWGYGAVDPSSGTAQLLETVRVLGQLKKEGWRPRRTLVFCSWGAEEYALIGSTEWVEEHGKKLSERAVAYINTDTCVAGTSLEPSASPLLKDMFVDATRMIKSPLDEEATLYASWKSQIKTEDLINDEPPVYDLGSSSDYTAFAFQIGVPSVDYWFTRNESMYNFSIYPAYHTGFDTFHLVDKLMDPDFSYHKTCSQIALVLLINLADSSLLPFNPIRYSEAMKKDIEKLKSGKAGELLQRLNISLGMLESSIKKFSKAVNTWVNNLQVENLNDELKLRMVNDQMMQLDRSFLLPTGLYGRPEIRHAIFAPSQYDAYVSAGFPGITDILYAWEVANTQEEQDKLRKLLLLHVSDVMILVHQATDLLKPLEII